MVWLPLSHGIRRCVDHVWGAAVIPSPNFVILTMSTLYWLLLLLTTLQ